LVDVPRAAIKPSARTARGIKRDMNIMRGEPISCDKERPLYFGRDPCETHVWHKAGLYTNLSAGGRSHRLTHTQVRPSRFTADKGFDGQHCVTNGLDTNLATTEKGRRQHIPRSNCKRSLLTSVFHKSDGRSGIKDRLGWPLNTASPAVMIHSRDRGSDMLYIRKGMEEGLNGCLIEG
jgi:hypothetical protein